MKDERSGRTMGALPAALALEAGRDLSLVRDARDGSLESFEALYRENVSRVYALCLRMCGERARAEDLTQEVFVRAWTRLGSFRGESRFSSWLHRLAVNVVLGDERSLGRRIEPVSVEADLEEAGEPVPAPEPGRSRDLERAIASLPRGAREVLILHDIEGYRHQEIAEMTGRATGTCKAQLHRARMLLREALK
jgi:RNA polymerase sigma-70 factor (ECF subfamily)